MFTYVFVMPSILQSQFIEKGFKKTENIEYSLVLLLFLYIYSSSFFKENGDSRAGFDFAEIGPPAYKLSCSHVLSLNGS